MTANVPVKFLFEGSNNMNSGDDTAKKGTSCLVVKKVALTKNQTSVSDILI